MIEHGSPPKYSILIPTRNREEYLPYAIASVLSQSSENFELVVSDNHSIDGTSRFLASLSDQRLRVISPSTELPMSNHYEFILSQARGEWVTILGDDDAVMPYLFERLDFLTGKFPEISIISSERANYFWEGCEDLYGDIVVLYQAGPNVETRSTKRDLFWALAGLRSCFNLPQIYTSSIVKRSLINEIKYQSGGYFFCSIIPDMYSVVALSMIEDLYLRTEEPLFWVGTSNKSMARSDRIYRDSELHTRAVSIEVDKIKPLKLNSEVSQKLHSEGLSSYYLYEAIMQCPMAQKHWRGRVLKTIVLASIKLLLRTEPVYTSKGRKDIIAKLADEEIRNSSIAPVSIWFYLLILRIFWRWNYIRSLFRRSWRKLTGGSSNISIISNCRGDFPTIRNASEAVLAMIGKGKL